MASKPAIRGNRKVRIAIWLTVLVTSMLIIPTLMTSIGGALGISLVWLPIGENTWVTFMSLLWGTYFTAHTIEKHNAFIQDNDYNHKLTEDAPLDA